MELCQFSNGQFCIVVASLRNGWEAHAGKHSANCFKRQRQRSDKLKTWVSSKSWVTVVRSAGCQSSIETVCKKQGQDRTEPMVYIMYTIYYVSRLNTFKKIPSCCSPTDTCCQHRPRFAPGHRGKAARFRVTGRCSEVVQKPSLGRGSWRWRLCYTVHYCTLFICVDLCLTCVPCTFSMVFHRCVFLLHKNVWETLGSPTQNRRKVRKLALCSLVATCAWQKQNMRSVRYGIAWYIRYSCSKILTSCKIKDRIWESETFTSWRK